MAWERFARFRSRSIGPRRRSGWGRGTAWIGVRLGRASWDGKPREPRYETNSNDVLIGTVFVNVLFAELVPWGSEPSPRLGPSRRERAIPTGRTKSGQEPLPWRCARGWRSTKGRGDRGRASGRAACRFFDVFWVFRGTGESRCDLMRRGRSDRCFRQWRYECWHGVTRRLISQRHELDGVRPPGGLVWSMYRSCSGLRLE